MDSSSTIASNGSARARDGAAKSRGQNSKERTARSAGKTARAKNGNGREASKAISSAGGLDLNQNELLKALHAMQAGDFSVRLPGHQTGVAGKIYDTFNTIVAANQRIAQQLEHVGEGAIRTFGRRLGRHGRFGQRAH
jgi:phage-related minor tail protein